VRISVLSHDLSHNCLGRAHVIASLLCDEHDVTIVGPVLGEGIWEPLRQDRTVRYRPVDRRLGTDGLVKAADGDLLYAVKPKGTSLGVALRARVERPRPVIADVDDWELGFFLDDLPWLARNLLRPRDTNGLFATWSMERAVRRADAVTVASRWLQRRFGGVLIPQVIPDDDGRPPDRRLVGSPENEWLAGRFVIALLGPHREEDIRTVLRSLDFLGDQRMVLVIPQGMSGNFSGCENVGVLGSSSRPPRPHPLAVADVAVFARQDNRTRRAGVPADILHAMDTGIPIVATAVSDLPRVLEGCGRLVPPGHAGLLARALRELMDLPSLRAEMVRTARLRARAEYSGASMRPLMELVVSSAMESGTRGAVEPCAHSRNM